MLKIVPGEAAIILSSDGEGTLLVSDLHLGMEKEMAKKGFSVPSYSMKMVERIRDISEEHSTARLVVLGDVKHSVGKVEDIDWGVVPWFFETMLDLFQAVEVVPGNHDGSIKTVLPQRVKLHPSEGAVLEAGGERIGVAHGHAWPSLRALETKKIVIGHSHFTYEMKDSLGTRSRESVWVHAKFDMQLMTKKAGYKSRVRGEGEVTVMPPFNRLVGGQPINRKKSFEFGPVLSSGAIDLGSADIFLLDGTRVA